MIGMLRGKIVDKNIPGKIIVDVSGVGYEVETSLITFFNLELQEGTVTIFIHTIVREDAFLLYGFSDREERELFRALIKVNGVGPKLAIAILSSIMPGEFVQCINSQNAALLTKLPGIGRKTAERLIVELKDSISTLSFAAAMPKSFQDIKRNLVDEAVAALEALGFKHQEAQRAINSIAADNKSLEQLIRDGLLILSSC